MSGRGDTLSTVGRWLARGLAILLLGLAAIVLWRELRGLDPADVGAAILAWGSLPVAGAVALTAASFTLLAGMEWLGLRWAGAKVGFRTAMLGSLAANALGHSLGFAVLVGGAVRAKLYARSGATLAMVVKTSIFGSVTFGVGLLMLAGLGLLLRPTTPVLGLQLHPLLSHGLGALMVAVPIAYVIACAVFRRPLRIARQELTLPSWGVAVAQLALGLADNAVCAMIFWVLLGHAGAGYAAISGSYAIATMAGLGSSVPGGAGVFEGVLLALLPETPRPALAAALLGYRLIYYVAPLALAAVLVIRSGLAETAGLRRAQAYWRLGGPWIVAFAAFALGASLILTGIGRIAPDRLAILKTTVPALVLETSHLLSLISGLALMAVSLLLLRRHARAAPVAIAAALVGASTALLRGLDVGPAVAATALAVVVFLGRGAFNRDGALRAGRLLPWWLVGMAAVLIGAISLGLWIYDDTPYEARLWADVGYHADPARFLRGMALVGGALLAGGAWALARASGPRADPASAADVLAIRGLVEAEPDTTARLALTGDKALLRSEAGNAFIMYAAEGRSLIAMGDPVGDADAARQLLWRFKECADAAAARPVIYHASPRWLTTYLDLGLSLLKLGEEARIPLADFDLAGSERRKLRQSHAKALREGLTFEVVRPPQSDALLAELEAISDAWLREHGKREKGFSLGRFERANLRSEPIALVRHEGRVVAFADVWLGGRVEASMDLMRRLPEAPHGVMDLLVIELILWAKAGGFQWFNLGLAPLSGLAHHPLAPIWHKVAAQVARHGGRFYGFAGLRAFKEKFDPVWMPRYLAAPPAALAAAMLDVTRLINRPARVSSQNRKSRRRSRRGLGGMLSCAGEPRASLEPWP